MHASFAWIACMREPIIIIIVSMYKIVSYDKKLASEINANLNGTHSISSCPDYFVKTYDETQNATTCSNTYTTPDGNYTYKMGGPQVTSNTVVLDNIDKQGQATLSDICDTISQADFTTFAWSDLKPKCDMS